jgi:hypothetical protein
MHKIQSPSTSAHENKIKKKRKEKKSKSFKKTKQNKIKLCTLTLCHTLDFTIQNVSNPKKRELCINNQSKKVI